ncbi:MAG: YjbH domain-containing protein [Rhodobacteraceae bacterium]|nr:YjbH domain-containing protein [Paracoccaceae bacterium]
MALAAPNAFAQEQLAFSTNSYGIPGLLDMPTGESFPDAELVTTFSAFSSFSRNTLAFQFSPRLMGAFRYSRLGDFFPDNSALFDRSFDFSAQVLREGQYQPSVVIGFQDILGTGIYQSEYIAATKTFGNDIRITGGLGWGRLGSYNSIGSPFGDRPEIDVGLGGRVNYQQWFRGPVAPFAGVAWRTTDKLTLKAEYSSDAYVQEASNGSFDRNSPYNVGFDYELARGVTASGSYMYGNAIGLQLAFTANPLNPTFPSGQEEAPSPVRPRPTPLEDPESWDPAWAEDPQTVASLKRVIGDALEKQGIILDAITLEPAVARLRIRNNRYRAEAQAIGRTTRILTRALPATVRTIQITSVAEGGIPTAALTFDRADVEQFEFADPQALLNAAQITDAKAVPRPEALPFTSRRFRWSLGPSFAVSLFDPDQPVRAKLGLRLAAEVELSRGVVFAGAIDKTIVGNLDEIERESDSTLPRVRSDIAEYERQGDPSIEYLTGAWYSRPAKDFFSRVTVGYFESMFGGVSGEILWKPIDSRLALGVELNYAMQRDFDQRFGFQDYSVVTGHASAYYEMDNGYNMRLHVGRYLAGDDGATLALGRRFANGWEVGAYVTQTNVTFEEFGEGSFDKGIRITIPFDWITGQPSRNRAQATLRSLSRDGGARLIVDGRLYDRVRDSDAQALENNWGRFWR